MGLFQKAMETYDYCEHLAGIQNSEYSEPLAPIGHITTNANLEIVISRNGEFLSASKVGNDQPKIVIPVTEGSAGRTSTKICSHPICDYLEYIAPTNNAKYEEHVAKLERWISSEYAHPMLSPILKYLKGKTILSDLKSSGITQKEKDTVRWVIVSPNEEESGACWTKQSLFKAFTSYHLSQKALEPHVLCMAEGIIAPTAIQHAKGVVTANGYANAKLISSNDESGFTYRGRFLTDDQALTVGYVASQKAHNALKWLVASQGTVYGGRTFLCWNPKGIRIVKPTGSLLKRREDAITVPSQYRKELSKAIMSYKNNFSPKDEAVTAVFDAATTGRLSVTYYNEISAHDFLDKLEKWDSECCWLHGLYGISAPSLDTIANCAFGREVNGRIEADEKILRQQIQRLITCKLSGSPMPYDIVSALCQKTANPFSYDKQLRTLQFTACAVIRKYYLDKYKEEYEMALEKDKKDISYQYGRLLAILEKAERDTYTEEGREPNAIRLQSAFCAHPAQTAETIIKQLKNGYYRKLSVGAQTHYDKLIGEIYEMLSEYSDAERHAALKETYILGYYLQKNALYTKSNSEPENNNENN